MFMLDVHVYNSEGSLAGCIDPCPFDNIQTRLIMRVESGVLKFNF